MRRMLVAGMAFLVSIAVLMEAGTVPFRQVGHLLVVECRLNGHDSPFNFVVDTGGRTFVDPETARGLSLKTKGFGVKIETLSMGDMKLEDVFGLMMFDFKPLDSLGVKISGMIGSDLLERFTVTFDYSAGKMELSRARNLDRSASGLCMKFTTHPVNNAPLIPLKIGDLPEMQVMIDTGQPMDLVIPLALWDRIRPPGKVIRARGVVAKWPMTRSRENRLTRLENVRVGSLASVTLPVFWAELPAVLSMPLLGRDFLSRYRVTLCYPAREVRFQSIGDRHPDAGVSTFGFYMYWDAESACARLRGVWEQSPADRAGLAPEDIVRSIQGDPVNHEAFPGLMNRMEDRNLKKLRMVVERNGRRRTVDLKRRALFSGKAEDGSG